MRTTVMLLFIIVIQYLPIIQVLSIKKNFSQHLKNMKQLCLSYR
jgi:hypothetical protein